MNKLIIAVVIVIIAAVAIMMLPPAKQETGTSDTVTIQEGATAEQTTVDESYLLEDLYISMLEEEMDALDMEQTDYNSEMEEQLASDMSQFYYE
ncbi:MAG: hypothetical protein ABIE55_01550 [Candidatus Aenigmatarchaeota archaeon]